MGACSQIESPRISGKYPLLEPLGEGNLGTVYRSFDQENGRPVAVRILAEGIKWDERLEELFCRECQAIESLHHPNIASVFENGKEDQSFFTVTESLGRSDLKSLIARKPVMPVEAKVAIMMQVAEGLRHAHQNGILHRNLSPAKIHLTADGVKIRDFSIHGILMKYLPRPGVRWGIPIYLSPEQIQNKASDARTDIYSAGVVFYELLTYCHPFFDPDSNKALDRMLLGSEIATFDQFPEIPPGVWGIVRKCLAKNPGDRYAGMDEFLSACQDLVKDMSEDIQLMLAELQSSLVPLKKAAVQPNASESILKLLHEIQLLLHDQKEADYSSLDRLVTALLDQQPAIQQAADLLQPWDSVYQLPFAKEIISTADSIDPTRNSTPSPAETGEVECDQSNGETPSEPGEISKQKIEAEPPWSRSSTPDPIKKPRESTIPWRYGKIPKKTYSAAAGLLSILLIVTAFYIVLGTEAGKSVRNIWDSFTRKFDETASASSPRFSLPKDNARSVVEPLSQKGSEQNREAGNVPLSAKTESLPGQNSRSAIPRQPSKAFAHISDLIDSGNLPMARIELDSFQKSHPGNPGIESLRKKWQERKSVEIQELARREQAKKEKENDWTRQVVDLFETGKYNKAGNALNLWLSEDPGNLRAQEMAAKNNEIQSVIKSYAAAITDGRYEDALAAVGRAEKLNPQDPSFAELRQQAEARKASAKASMTVRRLGSKARILLDGKPIGNDGELSGENVHIGSHTLAVESEGASFSYKIQNMREGEQLALVYDLAGGYVRPMIESDRELLGRRKAAEDVQHFPVDHTHGTLRGSCHGELLVNYLDVAYKPSSGSHGFRIPINQLKLRSDGRSVELLLVSDGSRFQSFKFADLKTAEQFKMKWDELKSKAPQ
jgi:serine/threonine protein kinase